MQAAGSAMSTHSSGAGRRAHPHQQRGPAGMRNFFQRQGKFRPRDDDERGDQTIPEDLWVKCPKCGELIYSKELERNAHVCPKCNHHFRLRARERIRLLADPGGFEEWDASLQPVDPLGFVDGQGPYPEKVAKTQAKTGEVEALITGLCRIEGRPLVLVVADFDFLGASMGSVWGEKLTRAASARWSTAAVLIRQCLGRRPHARGILSLMQMAKTPSAAFHRLGEARCLTSRCWSIPATAALPPLRDRRRRGDGEPAR